MNWWQRVRNRWRLEDQLDAELRFHFDQLVRDCMADGATGREARRRARAEFGSVEEIKDACRDARGTRWVHDIAQDLRFSARLLAKERSLTLLAVLALSLGVGVNTAMSTLVEMICIRGLPIPQVARVADIAQRDQTHPYLLLSPRQFTALETSPGAALEHVSGYTSRQSTLRDDRNATARVTVAYVSPDALATVGLSPSFGRLFRPTDGRDSAAPVAILSHALWQTRYDSSPSTIGRFIRVNGTPVSVVGVMRDGFPFPDNADVWRPLAALPLEPDARVLHVFARLSAGASMAQAQDAVSAALARVLPPVGNAAGMRSMVVPINTRFNGDITNPAWMAFITVGMLLVIIACSNVANLLLARGVRRRREIAIRLSLGATRIRIVRQLLVESLLLSTLGAMGAAGVSWIGLRLLDAAIPANGIGYWEKITMDWRVAIVLAVVCLGTVLVFGLAPALQLARTSVSAATKESSSSISHDRATGRWTWGFLICQLALTVVLVSALTLTFEGFRAIRAREPFIDAQRILTFGVVLPPDAYRSADRRFGFYHDLADRLAARSSAVVSVTAALPSQAGTPRRILPQDQPLTAATPPVSVFAIDSQYFDALSLNLLAGRAFARQPSNDDRSAIIVNQRFVDAYFHGQSAVGQRVRLEAVKGRAPSPAEVRTIVGVAPSLRHQASLEPPPIAYVPLTSDQLSSAVVLVRAPGRDAAPLAAAVRDEMRALDPNVPIDRLMSLNDANWEIQWNGRVATDVLTTIVTIALALAMIGLIALTSYGVGRRSREFGIRLALGARPLQVTALALRRVFWQVFIGMVAGSLVSIGWDHLFEPRLRTDPAAVYDNLAITALLLMLVMLAAAAWPARRAGQIDPLLTLKSE